MYYFLFVVTRVSIDEGTINILDLEGSEKIIDKGYEILICKTAIPNNPQGSINLVYDEVEFIDGKCDITEEEHASLEESFLPKVSYSIGGIIVSVLTSSEEDCGLEPQFDQTCQKL
jgi:hypothetical protein